jgi:hypothetical protein
MAEILARYGATWQIEIAEPASFIAIRRPTPTAQEILVAHSLAELDRKLPLKVIERPDQSPASTAAPTGL